MPCRQRALFCSKTPAETKRSQHSGSVGPSAFTVCTQKRVGTRRCRWCRLIPQTARKRTGASLALINGTGNLWPFWLNAGKRGIHLRISFFCGNFPVEIPDFVYRWQTAPVLITVRWSPCGLHAVVLLFSRANTAEKLIVGFHYVFSRFVNNASIHLSFLAFTAGTRYANVELISWRNYQLKVSLRKKFKSESFKY